MPISVLNMVVAVCEIWPIVFFYVFASFFSVCLKTGCGSMQEPNKHPRFSLYVHYYTTSSTHCCMILRTYVSLARGKLTRTRDNMYNKSTWRYQ